MTLPFNIDTPTLFAAIAIAVSVARYGTYLWSMYKKETTPHVFSWFNWGVIVGIGAFAQFKLDAGPSAWVLVVVSSTCLFIAFLALFVGEKNITKTDWMAFLGALIAIPIWKMTHDPFMAILTVIAIDILSYYPTIRKSWANPWGEPPVSYLWAGSRYFFTLFAVPEPTIQTLFYPFFLMSIDWGFAFYIMWRRKALSR